MSNKVSIYVSMHTAAAYPKNPIFRAIHAGKALSTDANSTIEGDDTGENISAKNREFCELTSLYWIGHNLPNTEYVGLCHHRRYFDFEGSKPVIKEDELESLGDLKEESITNLMDDCDIILVEPHSLKRSNRQYYYDSHYKQDLDLVEEIISREHPEYKEACDYILSSNKLSPYNMFICRSSRLKDYTDWLFSILLTHEKEFDLTSRSSYQQRLFGFLSERLLNIYCHHNKLRIKYLPITFILSPNAGKYPKRQSLFTRWKYNLKFALSGRK